jgi:Dolichyl-phosphate-mannose-protein mannosyltransferase
VWRQRKRIVVTGLLLTAAFSFRFYIARFLPNDTPGDSAVYTLMARNLLEQHVYSHHDRPPYSPSLIRLPGYSIFLAGIYSVFGHANNTAPRIVQATLDTVTCGLVAMIAYYWEPDEKRKRIASIAALALAAVCPFTAVYVGTILTETWACFLAVALCLLATLAFKASSYKRSLWWWGAAGLIGGVGVFFRPDAGLFVASVGLTLVISTLLASKNENGPQRIGKRVARLLVQGSMLSIAFVLVLVPWTVRNWREFHLFMPLAPYHGEMPGEFVPNGYNAWIRSWLDDRKYIEPMLWALDDSEIDPDDMPDSAFDSAEEKARVAQLLDQYNNPQEETDSTTATPAVPTPSPTPSPATAQANKRSAKTQPSPSPKADEEDKEDQGDQNNEQDSEDQPRKQKPEMTPAIDAGFGQIAHERIARNPLRYYLWLPLKRARSLWFGPHADYYPFAGELFPLEDLDSRIHQQIWLPLFLGLVWIYTLLGVGGGWRLWRSRDFNSRRWLLLAALLIFLRLAFLSTMENPEPRYTVEFFPFLAILSGIFLARLNPRSLWNHKREPAK